jgi:hypothetical protein
MQYYLIHRDDVEKDLNRNVNEFELNEANCVKKLEQELFYNQMCQLFDTEDESTSFDDISDNEPELRYEKAYMLSNFRILYQMNFHYATAQ